MQHPRQNDVDRKPSRAGHLGPAVLANNRLADHGEFGIWRKRRWLIRRN